MDVSESGYWKERYQVGEARWDLGGPCPVFVELLASPRAPPRGRVAFPGCGQGHDVRLFVEHGYDAVGFDFAVRPEGVPLVNLDVFQLGRVYPGAFDVIVEYTCYCAIDPKRRPEYATALRDALRPGGMLVALAFPVDGREGGPPFAVDEGEITGVLGAGLELLHIETPKSSVEPRLGRERLALFRKR